MGKRIGWMLLFFCMLFSISSLPAQAVKGIIDTTGLDSELYSVPKEEKKLIMFSNRSDLKGGRLEKYIREFQKQYTTTSVEVCFFDDYDNQVAPMMKTGNYGDIVLLPNNGEIKSYSSYFLDLGKVSDLEERYYFAHSMTEDGKVYCLPIMVNANGVAYNKRVFDEAGIKNVPRTEEEFLEAMRLIKENTDAIPCYLNYDEDWALASWEYYAYSTMTGNVNFKRNEITQLRNPFSAGDPYYTLYELLYDIAAEGYMENIGEVNWQTSKEMINTGKIGCMFLGSWAVTQFQDAGPNAEDIGYMAYPHSVDGKQYISIVSDYFVGIRKNTKYPEEAKVLLEYLIGSSGFAGDIGSISSDKSVPIPEDLYEIEDVSYVIDNSFTDVSGYQFQCLTKDLNLNNGSEIRRIIDAAIGKTSESFDDIMMEWNDRWESGRDNSAPDTDQSDEKGETYDAKQGGEIHFTDDEKKFFLEKKTLRVACLKDSKPWQYYEKDTEELDGMTAYLMDTLKEKMGVEIEYVPVDTIEEAKKLLKENKADIYPGYMDFGEETHSLSTSKHYMDVTYVTVQKKDTKEMNTVGIVTNYTYNKEKLADKEIITYKTVEKGLSDLQNGKIDSLYADYNSVTYQMNMEKYEDLTILPVLSTKGSVSIAYCENASVLLRSGINKVLYSISDDDMQAMLMRAVMNNAGGQGMSFMEFLQHNLTLCLMIVIGVISIILILVLHSQRMQKRLNQKISISNERYQLIAELSEELVFDYDVEKDTIFLTEYFAKQYHCKTEVNLSDENSLSPAMLLLGKTLKLLSSENVRYEFKFLTPDGTMKWFRILASWMENKSGETVRLIGKIYNIDDEIMEKQELEDQAFIDSLTGIYNRAGFRATVDKARETSEDKYEAFFIVDMDKFKTINDTSGHQAGDAVLKLFANTAKEVFSEDAIIGRWGGDEFVIFASCQEPVQLELTAKELRKRMNMPYETGNGLHQLSVSIGGCIAPKGYDMDVLFAKCDEVLYRVKNNGRNNCSVETLE